MKPHFVTAAAVLALGLPSVARAQRPTTSGEQGSPQRGVRAPSEAFELTIGTGYTQPFGLLRSGVGMPSIAGAGIGFDLGLGYRIGPRWGVSLGGQYQELTSAEQLDATRGFAVTFAVQYHLAPHLRTDPWLELGAGYRGLWTFPQGDFASALNHGPQAVRARVGLDVRVSPDIAFSPVIGADLTAFLWADSAGDNRAVSDPAVSTFVFAGVQARFDTGATHIGKTTTTSASARAAY